MSDTTKYLYMIFLKYNTDIDAMCNDFVCGSKFFSATTITSELNRQSEIYRQGRDFVKRFRCTKLA